MRSFWTRWRRLCRTLALEMDFGFLLDPDKKLLSIGFSVATNRLDTNCYDLLASEARLASLFAIAKGDVETRHWFRLGRPATPIGSGSALISWSGSMFEYLMPSLVMRAPAGSVLEQTTRLIVARQRSYAAGLGIPWGISEVVLQRPRSGDDLSVFQLRRAGLGTEARPERKPGDRALCHRSGCDDRSGRRGAELCRRLRAWGPKGATASTKRWISRPSRLPSDETQAIVRSFMAHHQGMTITAIANTLQDGRLRDRFHAEPMIQGVELLLQERIPRDVASAPPRATEVLVAPVEHQDAPAVRTFENPATDPPTAHLLSNGNYGVMLTADRRRLQPLARHGDHALAGRGGAGRRLARSSSCATRPRARSGPLASSRRGPGPTVTARSSANTMPPSPTRCRG